MSSTGRCQLDTPASGTALCPMAVSVAQPRVASGGHRQADQPIGKGIPTVGRGIVWPGSAARSGHGAQWPGALSLPCLQGTVVNTSILLWFPSISGRNRPTTAQVSVQPSWDTCIAGRARRDAKCVSREKKSGVGGPSPCELARISLRDTGRVVGPAGVCGVPVVVGCSRTWPDETGGLAFGSWVCGARRRRSSWTSSLSTNATNRLRVTVDPAATAAAIWTSDAVGHIRSITRPPAGRTRILEIPSPSPRPRPTDQRLDCSALRSGGSPRAPARSGARPGQPSRRARLRLGRGSPRARTQRPVPGLGHYLLPGMPGGPDCREAGGSR